jgi:hypothetical protein
VNVTLRLASDFIERAASAGYGVPINEEYTLRWLMLRADGDVMRALNVAELGPNDVDTLSPEAWVWLGASLGGNDPELPAALMEALFTATDDPIYRLRIADVALRHPSLSERYSRFFPSLFEAPPSWPRDRLLRLGDKEGERDGLAEMITILLQVGNKPSLRLLNGLRRRTPAVVDETLRALTGREGEALADLLRSLGLVDLE